MLLLVKKAVKKGLPIFSQLFIMPMFLRGLPFSATMPDTMGREISRLLFTNSMNTPAILLLSSARNDSGASDV